MVLAAFIVAAAGLLVAALSLGWQIASWTLDGRRVRVRLVHGLHGTAGSIVGPVKSNKRRNDLSGIRFDGYHGREVIGIAVTNVGRAPVRIDSYGVNLVRGGMSYRVPATNGVLGPELPFRLPAGETESWYSYVDDAEALVVATRGIARDVSNDVTMEVVLGTGDSKATKRSVIVAD